MTDAFRDLSAVRYGTIVDDDAPDAGAVDSLDAGQNPLIRNSASYELEHSFTRRWVGVLAGSHDLIDYQRNLNQSDSVSLGVQGFLQYALSRRDRVGAGVGYAYQSFDAIARQPGSRGQIWNASVTYDRRFDDDLRLSLSAGPTFIQTEAENVVPAFNYGIGVDAANNLTFPVFATCAMGDPALGAGEAFERTCARTTLGPGRDRGRRHPFSERLFREADGLHLLREDQPLEGLGGLDLRGVLQPVAVERGGRRWYVDARSRGAARPVRSQSDVECLCLGRVEPT